MNQATDYSLVRDYDINVKLGTSNENLIIATNVIIDDDVGSQ